MTSAHKWAVAIAILFTVGGFFAGLVSDGAAGGAEAISGLIVVPLYVLTYLWMKADARERVTSPPPGATPLVVGLLPVAVPYHLIATRRGWRKATALIWLFGFVALNLTLYVAGAYAGVLLTT